MATFSCISPRYSDDRHVFIHQFTQSLLIFYHSFIIIGIKFLKSNIKLQSRRLTFSGGDKYSVSRAHSGRYNLILNKV